MRLYLSDMHKSLDLFKASTPTGGGGGTGVPKVPGAATPGGGVQTQACPLGAACTEGGQHQVGSGILAEHTAQANNTSATGVQPGDESTGEESGKPGVPPGAANIGGLGSDQVKRVPPPVQIDANYQSEGQLENEQDGLSDAIGEWKDWENNYSEPRPSLESHLRNSGITNEKHIKAAHEFTGENRYAKKAPGQGWKRPNAADTGESQAVTTGEFHTELDESGPKGHEDFSAKEAEENPSGAKTRSFFQGNVSDQSAVDGPKPPPLPRKSPGDQVAGQNLDRPGMGTTEVPNPLSADPTKVPPDSKPMDHYKLSKIARESGDEELAKFHEGMARKRTDGMGSADHKKLAEDLHKEGMHDQAEFHEGIHRQVTGESEKNSMPMMVTRDQHQQLADLGYSKEARNKMSPEEAHGILDGKKQEGSLRDVHHEAKTKAAQDFADAKAKHEETKAKADKIRASNEEKQKKYEADLAAHAKAKEDAKNAKDKSTVKRVGKPPQKPKLEKEEKVPEKPELYKPEEDADKLRHEGHTDKARRLADLAESHLKGNKNLSDGEKARLERAHKMATYHANIEYTPTAAHKKELGEVEQAISGMGIKQNHAEMEAAENAKQTAEAAKKAEKDRVAGEKQQQKQAKLEEKTQAKDAKQQQKLAAAQPKAPQTPLDHARMTEHNAAAQKLRANIESHMNDNPDMTPEERQKNEHILTELAKHENLDMMPGSDHQSELKELQKLAGEHGKKTYEPEGGSAGGGSAGGSTNDRGHNHAFNMIHSGRALGQNLAASAQSPYGQAGQAPTGVINYGTSGATSAGHHLLRERESTGAPPEEKAEKPEARPQQSSLRSSG